MPPDHNKVHSDKTAAESLQKKPSDLLSDIHCEIEKWDDLRSPHRIQFAFASLLSVLAEQSEKSTKKVIHLTWALVVLTIALLVFTIYLCQDAYFKSKRDQDAYQHHPQQIRSEIKNG
jgi:hypothetical protein